MANRTQTPRSAFPAPRLIVPKLLAWFAVSARDLPWRRTRDPYAIWVSEIMLQQTQVKTVIPYWERWMRELPTIQSLARARPQKIHKLWEGLGYYTRVRNMQKAAQVICSQHSGQFPTECDAILDLPGIGRYTAGAIASIAFNQPAPILDGNVIRVLCRLHGIAEDPQARQTNAHLWKLAAGLVHEAHECLGEAPDEPGPGGTAREDARPANACSHLNQSLMELGALICTPRSPDCTACPVAKHCVAYREDRIAELPRPKQRTVATTRRILAFIIEHDGKFLVQQRAAGVVNAHLWEFPNVEAPKGRARHSVRAALLTWANGAQGTDAPCAAEDFHLVSMKPFYAVKHSITRYRITTEAFRVPVSEPVRIRLGGKSAWRTPAQLRKLPFTSAHRKIAARL